MDLSKEKTEFEKILGANAETVSELYNILRAKELTVYEALWLLDKTKEAVQIVSKISNQRVGFLFDSLQRITVFQRK
ncbi:hypothetical protein [Anaeromusa sp.]|uniref:hypothetical protein n=1 Tax=Anaeromusa sp. TaxID=1872520 RepID=UPI002611E83C|nr:hypothetical protein [Anaeromusa sp.]MDD3157478.1 hypothetical protein [Anaeromusa sp.]